DAVAESTDGFCGPLDSAFEHVRALDNRRSTARHNSIGALKPADLSGKSTTLCQFSQWRAVGGWRPKRLDLSPFSTARHFELGRAARARFTTPHSTPHHSASVCCTA